jgi:alpha-beta hydrolase superfamily lysophospholipase
MNANLADTEAVSAIGRPVNEAIYFPADDRRLCGWIYWPSDQQLGDLGLVICKPFGYEALCAHRSLRAFAEMAASIGVPALSFDYLGTGDSADMDPRADQLAAWCQDVVSAIAELRRRTGVRRVCLLGFRLGALVARLAAGCTAVDALLLLAPVTSGKAYVRELRTSEQMAARALPPDSRTEAMAAAAADGSMEVGGYYISAATIARLSELSLDTLGVPAVSALMVIDRSGLPDARAWVNAMSAADVKVDYAALAGFVEMMMTPPQFTRIPQAVIGHVRDWLGRFASPGAAPRSAIAANDAVAPRKFLSLRDARFTADPALSERPVHFGAGGLLFGILTEPRQEAPTRRGILLVNAGADSHVCIGRIYVMLAREWARRGYVVLRMDFAGLGDSGTHEGGVENEVYPRTAFDDIRAAVELLRGQYRVGDIALGGLCSGAYHALTAAIEEVPVEQVLVVNPQVFFWRQGTSLEGIQVAEMVSAPDVYNKRLRSLEYWKKLLTGRANVWHIGKVYGRRLAFVFSTNLRKIARFLRVRLPDDLAWELERIVSRGVRVDIVFASGEPGIKLLEMQAGSVRRWGDRCRLHIIEHADHTFSRAASRNKLERVLSEALGLRPESNRALS